MNNLIIDIKSVKLLPKAKRKSLNFLIQLSNKHDKVYPTQEKISQFASCRPEWVSKMTTEWHERGWLTKTYRHMTSCVYELSSFWFDFNNRQALKDILPALAWIPLSVGMLINTELTKSSNDTYRNISYNSEVKKLESKMSKLHEQIAVNLSMTDEQIRQLSLFSDNIVKKAYQRITTAAGLRDKISYFFAICRKEASQPEKNKQPFPKSAAVDYVSDNFGLTNHAKPPIYNAFVSEVKSADDRKESLLRHKEWKAKRNNYIDNAYGKTVKEIKEIEGYVAIGELLKPYREPLVEVISEEDSWWSQQEPMDTEDYYQI